MNTPTWIRKKIVDSDGVPTNEYDNYWSTLNTQMQLNLSDDGIAIPSRTTQEIDQIFQSSSVNTQKPQNLMLFDKETNELKIRDANGATRIISFV